MLHSGGFVDDRRGFVVFGHSGAGKTTICTLASDLGLTVLSDELNAIRPAMDGSFVLSPLPFAGDFGRLPRSIDSVPLAAIYHLAQRATTKISQSSHGRYLGHLAASSPFINIDPTLAATLMDNLSRLLHSIQVKTLEFSRSPRFWEVVKSDVESRTRPVRA